ncbi:MAG: hypothetical protein GY738_16895, partial [Pseudoalteromonas sp.]|nr:hypothetical protein [Pseudoalteromonas sp.]
AKLIGDYGESDEFHLHKSVKGGNKFETGATDVFKFEKQPYVGELQQLQIRHDNKGLFGSSWFLDSVKVHDSLPNINYNFVCRDWLDKKHGLKKTLPAHLELMETAEFLPVTEAAVVAGLTDEQLERLQRKDDDLADYRPGHYESQLKQKLGPEYDSSAYYLYTEAPIAEVGPMTSYTVTVKTSNVESAGTDAKVTLALTGDAGTTPPMSLDKKNKKTKGDPFEQGKVDSFLLANTPSAGNLTMATIACDQSGLAPAWHLDSITVHDQMTGEKYFFPCKQWLDKEHGTSRDLPVVLGEPVTTNFTISVTTGSESGAGTDANVYAKLIGDYGESDEFHLHKSVKGGNKFETGATDVFKFEKQPYVGELQQ